MNHFMIDLETLDTKPSAKILSIGVVKFNPLTGELGEDYYTKLDSSLQKNRTASESTKKWWNGQEEHVRQEAFSGHNDLDIVLKGDFKDFILSEHNPKVWSNGATFDISILEHAYDYNVPWKFWNVQDVRTITDLAYGFIFKEDIPFEGDAHNALDDAIYQAKYVSAMYKALREGIALSVGIGRDKP